MSAEITARSQQFCNVAIAPGVMTSQRCDFVSTHQGDNDVTISFLPGLPLCIPQSGQASAPVCTFKMPSPPRLATEQIVVSVFIAGCLWGLLIGCVLASACRRWRNRLNFAPQSADE